MLPIQLSITLALVGAGVLAVVALRRRRARDRQRLRQKFTDRQPWLHVYAEADRAIEPDAPPPQPATHARPAHARPLALGGVTVAAAVATVLLVVRPALAPNSDAPAGDSGSAETTTRPAEPALTREPARPQSPPVIPRASRGPAETTLTDAAPGTTQASRPHPTNEPEVSTTTPTATSDNDTTTTTTAAPPTDTDEGHEPDTEPERPRPGASPDGPTDENTHPDRGRPDDERPERGPRSLVLSLVETVVDLVDPRR